MKTDDLVRLRCPTCRLYWHRCTCRAVWGAGSWWFYLGQLIAVAAFLMMLGGLPLAGVASSYGFPAGIPLAAAFLSPFVFTPFCYTWGPLFEGLKRPPSHRIALGTLVAAPGLYLVGSGFLGLGVGLGDWLHPPKGWPHTTGQVQHVQHDRQRAGPPVIHVTYTYEVQGWRHHGLVRVNADRFAGGPVQVSYDPLNPARSTVEPESFPDESPWFAFLILIGEVLLTLGWYVGRLQAVAFGGALAVAWALAKGAD